MSAPFEILASPLTIYVAAAGEAFPVIDAAVAGNWIQLGTSGNKNYSDDGVTVTHEQTVDMFRAAGTTGARKAFRSEEDLKIVFTLVDLTPEQYAKILNDASLTTVPQSSGVAGQKHFETLQGLQVTSYTLLARGISSVDEDLNSQYEVPLAIQGGNPEPVYNKGEPAGLECEFMALQDSADGFGKLRIQTTVAGA